MHIQNYLIKNKTGLHARPASLFVRKASQYKCDIRLRKEDYEVDAKSMISVLTLEAAQGCMITIILDGEDENLAMTELVGLLDTFED
ncbi:MAG TPA: HPr family phosphocarrier protein [Anaerovoracaceae bacterium]|nr:HPr family phosphocarrier protein [Anaerovoracaceae bacterium]